jgi:hypothetical protein
LPVTRRQLDHLWRAVAGRHQTGGEALEVRENQQHGERTENLGCWSPEHRGHHYRANLSGNGDGVR